LFIFFHKNTAVVGTDKLFLEALKIGLAKAVSLDDKTVKFDEIGVLSFGERMPEILKQGGFEGTVLNILQTFCIGLGTVYKNLLQTPSDLTGDSYETLARVNLGFQMVQIFATLSVTASIKQLVAYVPYYVDKALNDARTVGLPLTLSNFSDATMETAHKTGKQGNFLFSGGRDGAISKYQYQKQVISRQFENELLLMVNRESTPQKSSSAKAARKEESSRKNLNTKSKVMCLNLVYKSKCQNSIMSYATMFVV
jgi:hypothetical protein